ncbi:acidic leucine-rich nuclear phosphoprotein 32 family member A-like isoform X2 [Gigantopelta aegis]|uniref:acidic leucine-rich nuclear phosphoprotein 32 family member A-like isoform X2 n=1 Tax=Gigantopelta aegis TaxID=1735272 RepID=UPI001B88B35E|nr:acidic leucine-rich nuclear phosphoprotein 32 family member A-like isoform X2 [Gigantopelta aegis]
MSNGMQRRIELEMRGRKASQIKELNLDNCRATEIEGFDEHGFSALESLSLINVGLTSLQKFPALEKLKKLELSDNRISSGLEVLQSCKNLTHLNLSGNKIKDIDSLKPLADLKNLKNLDLFNCEITNKEEYRESVFEVLPQITYLDGYDKDDKECLDDDEEVECEDDDDDDDEDDDEELDEEDEEEVGLAYLQGQINEEDEEGDEDFDEDDDDDDVVEEEDEEDEEEEEDEESAEARGTKRKHEPEPEPEHEDDEEEETA